MAQQPVSKAIVTDGQVIDVFTAAGLKQPDISIPADDNDLYYDPHTTHYTGAQNHPQRVVVVDGRYADSRAKKGKWKRVRGTFRESGVPIC